MTSPTVIETTAPPVPVDPDPFIADMSASALQPLPAPESALPPRRRRIVD